MDDDPLIKCTATLGYYDEQAPAVEHPPPPARFAGSEAAAELLPASGSSLTGGRAFTPAGQSVRRIRTRSTRRHMSKSHTRHPEGSPSPPRAPLNVQYVPEGGVAIDGRQGLPIGVPTTRDHLVGKLKKVRLRGGWKAFEEADFARGWRAQRCRWESCSEGVCSRTTRLIMTPDTKYLTSSVLV